MPKVLPRKYTTSNVLEASLTRIACLYERFDRVVVSFSAGKDSTVCLQLALQVAREKNKLPLDVYFFDEEAIHPETVAYAERVAAWPDVRFLWFCVPVRHRNACSKTEPYWYPWAEEKKPLWVRDFPKLGISELKGFERGMDMPTASHLVYADYPGTVAHIRGIRAQESMRRLRSVSQRETDNWIAHMTAGTNSVGTSPIYDWHVDDVWVAPKQFGWDYNRTYDVMDKAGISKNVQRVCPPYGEEPLGGLYQYAECWPDLWHKMLSRVTGVATAARYARTDLYGFGKLVLPSGKTWRGWMEDQLAQWPEAERAKIRANIAYVVRYHNKKTLGRPIPDVDPDSVSGVSWAFLCLQAVRGDLKGRRRGGLTDLANKQMLKEGKTLEQVRSEVR